MLTFIVPVRHHATATGWPGIKARMASTLRSMAAQDHPDWRAIIVANRGADLPEMPSKTEVIWVDFPPHETDAAGNILNKHNAVRCDKGLRILVGIIAASRGDHIMSVDYDDLVSCRLARLVADNPGANGWYFDAGYLYSGGEVMLPYGPGFSKFCGTSHIVHAELLSIPASVEDANMGWVYSWLGCHIFIQDNLQKAGTPLSRLPFPGAVYRIGHPGTDSNSPSLAVYIANKARQETRMEAELTKAFVQIGDALKDEFFGGAAAGD